MHSVDRAGFLAWNQGMLLDFRYGRGVAANEEECEAASAALERGERVGLRVGGRIATVLVPTQPDGTVHEEDFTP